MKKILLLCLFMSLSHMFYGCTILETSDKKISEIEYQLVEAQTLPEEVCDMIEERKEKPFQMAYHNEEHSYIILGYGKQETSGFSIRINDVYQGENGIWVDTDLIGPEKGESVETVETFPYVIIQTQCLDQVIHFKD